MNNKYYSYTSKRYRVRALDDSKIGDNSWTKGKVYQVTETTTKIAITTNQAKISFGVKSKDEVLKNFEVLRR